jgi:hypothetical protein
MKDIRAATADEMILSFVQGEIDSPRWKIHYDNALALLRADRAKLVDRGDITDAQQNADRRRVLSAVRGYGRDEYLFKGFPVDTVWRLVTVTLAEVTRFKYMNQDIWSQLSAGTRAVADGAQNLDQLQVEDIHAIRDKVNSIAGDLQKGVGYRPLIGVQCAGTPDLVLIDGHHRATAYARAGSPSEIEVYIGTSARMRDWYWF